jgi:hypothetical protein
MAGGDDTTRPRREGMTKVFFKFLFRSRGIHLHSVGGFLGCLKVGIEKNVDVDLKTQKSAEAAKK